MSAIFDIETKAKALARRFYNIEDQPKNPKNSANMIMKKVFPIARRLIRYAGTKSDDYRPINNAFLEMDTTKFEDPDSKFDYLATSLDSIRCTPDCCDAQETCNKDPADTVYSFFVDCRDECSKTFGALEVFDVSAATPC
jgi:hypothetical protein